MIRNVSKDASDASRHSLLDWHGRDHLDARAGKTAPVSNRLNACLARRVKCCPVGEINVAGELETLRRADLDEKQHHGAASARRHGCKLDEMLRAALGRRIGEFGKAGRAHEM